MPNTREKLIELLSVGHECPDGRNPFLDESCSTCPYYGAENCDAEVKADRLIANGVTFHNRDCHWATEQAYKNGKADALKWISVKERLPETDGNYLVYQEGYIVPAIRVLSFAKDGRKVDKYDFYREWKNVWYRYDSEWGHITIDDVTHWMPLPEMPKGE